MRAEISTTRAKIRSGIRGPHAQDLVRRTVASSLDGKTLWIVSGGAEAVPGIQKAKELGLHVVVSDMSSEAPGLVHADDRVLVSTYDAIETTAAAIDYDRRVRRVDGVIAMAADVPVTVASVADALDLPGISLETARLAADKLLMKQQLAAAGIPVPWFRPVLSVTEVRTATEERGFPLVIKPVDSRGARGVLRLTGSVDLDWAFGYARSQSPSGRVMVEDFLQGPQISTESLLQRSLAVTPGFIDRNYELLLRFAPYIIENGGQQPSCLTGEQRRAVASLAERAARALGITDGTAKGDLVLTQEGPRVIEMAARLSGGWMSSDQIPLATGVDFIGQAIRLALGSDIDLTAIAQDAVRGVACRYFFPNPGRVRSITPLEEISRQEGVHRIGFFVRPGEVLNEVTDHTRRAGFVIATGNTRDEAVTRAEAVVAAVQIETEPD